MLNAQARGESGQQPHDGQQHQLDQQEHTPTVTKAKRGPTRNIELANKRLANSNLIVEFDAVSKRIVGRDAQDFITELGCIVRKMARFNKPNFASQDERLKDEIIRKASEGFVYEDGRLARQCINNQLANQFKSHKHALHRIFLQFSSKEKALKHVPTDVIEEDWISLYNHFDSKEYKDMCARNAKNRAKNKTPSTVGSKSLARIIDEKEKLETLQATTDLSPTEICVQELHSIPGHLRGHSLSTKQILSMEGMQNEIEKQRQRADEANKNAAAMIDKVNAEIEEIKRMNEKIKTVMNQVELLVKMRSKKKCKFTQS